MDNDFFLNSGIQPQLQFELYSDCFFNPNLENSMDQFSQFESALSSMVSSPVSASNSAVSNENLQIRELIGKLGTICNSGDIQAQAAYLGSTNTSCYATPINSPPKLNYPITDQFVKSNFPNSGNSFRTYPPVQADHGFAERAAKFSCFGSRSLNGRTGQLGQNNGSEFGNYRLSPLMGDSVKLTRVLSSPSINVRGSQMGVQENKNLGQNQVEIRPNQGSPVSAQIPDSSSKKRKALFKGKTKESKVAEENKNLNSKRHKDNKGNGSENGSGKTEVEKQANGNSNGSENEEAKANTKPPEPPKDYIHVRARRGQATDSHSLAERVRREKISERMKLLQDIVPGCNKVTGKALMLDEIINYVQSLQRQVEFLSMKLATVTPRLDFNVDSLLHKNVMQPNGTMGHQMDPSASAFYGHHTKKLTQIHNNITNGATMVDPLHTIFRHNIGLRSSQLDEFAHGLTQFQTLCEDDLQSIVQMGLGPDLCLNAQGFPGSNQASHMKVGCEK